MKPQKSFYSINTILTVLLIIFSGRLAIAETSIKQPEQKPKQIDVARPDNKSVYEGAGYQIIQFKHENLSVYSYLVASDKEAFIVDPVRDISPYLNYAKKNKLKWKGTLLTQTHSDFVAGHREMSFSTGTPVYAGSKSKNLFPYIALEDGKTLELGSITLEVMHTPGHTIDSISLLVNSEKGKKDFLISGDTVLSCYSAHTAFSSLNFSPAELAEMLFDSWNEKLSVLPDRVFILPAHHNNLFCSKKDEHEACSTIGKIKKNNKYFRLSDNKSLFLNKVVSGLKKTTKFNKKIALINQQGPELVDWQKPYKEKLNLVTKFYSDENFLLFDLREFIAYKSGHIKGALNLSVKDNFEQWFPEIINPESKIVLYGPEKLAHQIARRLKIIGIDSYRLDESHEFITKHKILAYIKPEVFYEKFKQKKFPPVINVSLSDQDFGIETDLVINKNIFELKEFLNSTFSSSQEFVLLGNNEMVLRLSAAIMEKSGFANFKIFSGGTLAWVEAGLP
ncbi:MAG: MBL fold metallo-hydrolase, partial [Candidatus Rifleibacteriota bacterium]